MRSRVWLAVAAVALVAGALLVLPHDLHGLRAAVAAVGPWGPLVLLGVWIAGTPLLVPGPVMCALAGILFGPVGIAVSLLGSPLGALLAFLLARHLVRPLVGGRLPRPVAAVAARLETGGVRAVTLVRMAPGLPVGLFNHACGVTQLRARHFLAGSALGAAPRVVLYGLAGGTLATTGPLVLGGIAVAAVAAVAVTRRLRTA